MKLEQALVTVWIIFAIFFLGAVLVEAWQAAGRYLQKYRRDNWPTREGGIRR